MAATPPGADVIESFGVEVGTPELLPGGQRRSWLVGDAVFKPVDDITEHAWVSEVFSVWDPAAGVRVPVPLRSSEDRWCWEGWAAHRYVVGRPLRMSGEANIIRAAAESFHAAVAALPRASFLDSRDDPWAFGDRVAWEGRPAVGSPETIELVEALLASYRGLEARRQMVHGDIGGNVLGGDGLRPAVIDWPPYWRPSGWALAVAAFDAVCWEGVTPPFLDEWADVADWDQVLLRAAVYRLATVGRTERDGYPRMPPAAHAAEVRPAVDAVLRRAR